MSAQPQRETWTQEEYLAMEEKSSVKHELVHGIPYAMAGGTFNHTTVCSNLVRHTMNRLSGKPCRARSSEQKIKIEKSGNTFYPDAVIFCPPSRFEGKGDQILLTATVIFEVLSPSTAEYDRADKFKDYRRIETLTDYVLIEAERIYVEHFHRTSEGWLWRVYSCREENLSFPDLEIELPLAEIYDELDLPEALFLVQTPQLRDED